MEKVKTLLTEQGYQELKNELDNLINVKRPENIKAIKDARALGDLSENAEYDAARNEQAEIEGRISQLEKLLENVEIIDENKQDKSKVNVGSTVEIKYIDHSEIVKIIDVDEDGELIVEYENEQKKVYSGEIVRMVISHE